MPRYENSETFDNFLENILQVKLLKDSIYSLSSPLQTVLSQPIMKKNRYCPKESFTSGVFGRQKSAQIREQKGSGRGIYNTE